MGASCELWFHDLWLCRLLASGRVTAPSPTARLRFDFAICFLIQLLHQSLAPMEPIRRSWIFPNPNRLNRLPLPTHFEFPLLDRLRQSTQLHSVPITPNVAKNLQTYHQLQDISGHTDTRIISSLPLVAAEPRLQVTENKQKYQMTP
jgi:hypothetical protein